MVVTDVFHSTRNPWRACSRHNSILRCRSNSLTMQSREPNCRTVRAHQLDPKIPRLHLDNRNIHCREPSQSLYMKNLNIPDIRHHSQIRWPLLTGSKSFLLAWFRLLLTFEIRGSAPASGALLSIEGFRRCYSTRWNTKSARSCGRSFAW